MNRVNCFKLARMRHGMSQKEAAIKMSVSAPYLSRIEHGEIVVSPRVLRLMRDLYEDQTLTQGSF